MKLKCKGCGLVILDTKNNIRNCTILIDTVPVYNGDQLVDIKEKEKVLMCMNCGRRVEFSKIEKLGISQAEVLGIGGGEQ